jgi:beta-glucosidase
VEVEFAAGYRLDGDHDSALAEEAVSLAAGADVVVMFLGLPAAEESEGFDRSHLELPRRQVDLLERVAAGGTDVAVVLANGSAVATAAWDRHARAVVETWLAGQAGGGAVADLLLGVANPCGRLAETIPLRLEDGTAFLNFPGDSGHVRYGEGVFVGYRGHDRLRQEVAYPFGHGLSYTTFAYEDARVDVTGSHEAGDLRLTVTCRVSNTGDRAGKEVVQVYVGDVEATVARPPWELRGFVKLDLAPGESADAVVELDARDLSFWSPSVRDWVLEAGEFRIGVGASSRDLRTVVPVQVDAPRVAPPLGPMSSLQEWLADPTGAAVLREVLGTTGDGRLAGVLGQPELQRVVGNFPMETLAGFPNVDLDHATLDDLVARARRPATAS